MKVSELTGAKLAQWVALALGYKIERDGRELVVYLPTGEPCSFGPHGWRPDLNWAHGGPIIQSEDICTAGNRASYSLDALYHGDTPPAVYDGATKLQAAMRAFVASKYGEEVPDAA